MEIKHYHDWDVSPAQAAIIQKDMAQKISHEPLLHTPRHIAGADISYDKGSEEHLAAVVVLSFPELKVVETVHQTAHVSFPYIPGFLSFREVPLLAAAFLKLQIEPDLILCDGQGICHPRRMGLATHLGLILDKPTVGAAKSLLCGSFEEPKKHRGAHSPILYKKEDLGVALRTKDHVAPMIVSIGNKITLPEVIKYVLACATKYRMPEPTRQAHNLANKIRKENSNVSL